MQIFTQCDARFFLFSRKSSRSLIRKSLRGKFRKNQNNYLENSSLLQCKAKTLYYNRLEGFLFEIIFSTVTVELTVDFFFLRGNRLVR